MVQQVRGTRNRISFCVARPIPNTLHFVSFTGDGCEHGILILPREDCVCTHAFGSAHFACYQGVYIHIHACGLSQPGYDP